MTAIFDALPGIEVPVGEINRRLNAMWSDLDHKGDGTPTADDAKATQVNFVLHFGFRTTPEDAAVQFQTVVRFSRRYPSRVVVLCPIADEAHGGTELRAKIYAECFLGKSRRDRRCIEFVLLSYPRTVRQYLEDEVSICLSADLPMYYWAHRFSQNGRLADYQYLLKRAKRVLIDSAVAPEDALTYPWPRPESVRDLAHARLLPVRQSVGQFLAAYSPAMLAGGLRAVGVAHSAELAAEGRALLRWTRQRLQDCGTAEAVPYTVAATDGAGRLRLQFTYDRPGKAFSWAGDVVGRHAVFDATFDGATTCVPAAASLLDPESALGEAMYF